MDERLFNTRGKIVIQTPFALEGKILEITDTHHVIETSSAVMTVKNEDVLKVDIRKSQRIDSDLP